MDPSTLYVGGLTAATVTLLLLAHRLVQRATDPGANARGGLLGPNRAWALREVGDVLAVFLIGGQIVHNCTEGEDPLLDAVRCASFGLTGLALLEGAGMLGTRALLGARLPEALERGNVAAGLAVSAHYAATGLLVSRAVAGTDAQGFGLSLAFFGLAAVAHQGVVAIFRALTAYDDAEQIAGENLAAAVSYAGVSLASAVIVARALEGDFEGWGPALLGFGATLAPVLLLYPVRQILVQTALLGERPALRGGALDEAIGAKRHIGAAALEAAGYVGTALALVGVAG